MDINIDEEIDKLEANLKKNLDESYIPKDVFKKLLGQIATAHAVLTSKLDDRIYFQLSKITKSKTPKGLLSLMDTQHIAEVSFLSPLLNRIAFMRKVKIVEGYGDTPKGFVNAMQAVNNARNTFSHPNVIHLVYTYSLDGKKSVERLRKIFLELETALEMMNVYMKNNEEQV